MPVSVFACPSPCVTSIVALVVPAVKATSVIVEPTAGMM